MSKVQISASHCITKEGEVVTIRDYWSAVTYDPYSVIVA